MNFTDEPEIGAAGSLRFGSPGNMGTVVFQPDSWTLSSSPPFVTIAAGTLSAGNSTLLYQLLSSTDTITTISSGATLDLNNQLITAPGIFHLQGSGTLQSGSAPMADLAIRSGNFAGEITGAAHLWKSGGGSLTLTGANTYTGGTTIDTGTLRIGNGGVTGSILGDITNNSILVFNRSNDHAFAGVISGAGSVTKMGDGILTLSGTNTYTGATTITAGTLHVTGSLGDTLVAVNDTATLSGTGTIGGTVNVNDGGTLSPGASAGTLTLNNLILNSGSISLFELGTVSDLVNVTDTLTLNGGGLNIHALAGFDEGTYTLFNYGTRSGTDLSILNAPAGFSYELQLGTGTSDAVSLLVSVLASDLFWNGPNTTVQNVPNGTGGDGVWNNTSTNWTNAPGTANAAWNGANAYFAGDAGTVTMEDDISVERLEFLTTGYSIESDTHSLMPDGVIDVMLGTGIAASISAPITGMGGINKVGSGVLSLSGENTYQGGTTIHAGTVQTASASALGTGPVTLQGGSLAPLGQLNIASLDWNGGTISSILGTHTSLLNIAGPLTLGLGGGLFEFIPDGGFAANTDYNVLNAANLGTFTEADFAGNPLFGLAPVFTTLGDQLLVSFQGPSTGPVLQNAAPVFTPANADFLVNGPVTTGGPADNNMVNSLTFNPGSSLQVLNNLTVSSGNLSVPTGNALLSGGTVIIPGSLAKTGSGMLNTTGNIMVGGATNVQQGALMVNGTLSSPGGLTVFQNAMLGGAGVINGNILNNGVVSPGNSPGVLTINGNYTQSRSGTLQIEIGDLLRVHGIARLAGTLRLLRSGRLSYGQQIKFLEAASIRGDFDQILMPNPDRFRGRFLAQDGTGILLVAPTSYTLVAQTPNQMSVAKALDSFIPERGNDREVVSIALDLQTAEQYPAAFDRIAPTYYENLAQIVVEQAFARGQQMNQRMSAVRLGSRGFQAVGIEHEPLVYDRDGKRVVESKTVIQPSVARESAWSQWAMADGMFARVTSVSQLPNYRFDSGGFLFGADYTAQPDSVALGSQVTLGVYAGYQYTWADGGNAGTTQVNSALFGGYASYSRGGFYADAILGGGYNDFLVRRSIEFSTIDRTARGKPDGGQFNTSLNLGYDWQVGKFTLGPVGGLQYTYAGIGGFTETGADSLNLRVGSQSVNSLRSTLGGRVAYTLHVTENIAVVPELRVLWQHEYLNNSRNISSALDGGAGPTFGYETRSPARDSLFAGAGVSAQFGNRWSGFMYYNVDAGRRDFLGHSVSGGVGVSW